MSLVGADGGMDLYDGTLRAIDARRAGRSSTASRPADYRDYLVEEVRSWSYMKFPHIRSLGRERRLVSRRPAGPAQLLRLHRHAASPRPPARSSWRSDMAVPVHATLAYHWARLICMIHCAENDQGPAVRRRPSGDRPDRDAASGARKALRSSRRRAGRCFTTTRSTTTTR